MDALTLFGLFAVTAMLVCYALEDRSHWFVLLFAASCALGSAYLGGFTWARLTRALRVQELASGAAARVDAIFQTTRAPWCPETF